MKLQELKFLADENIHSEVVSWLRSQGWDIVGVVESGWSGKDDRVVLHLAADQQRVVLTHDRDFGKMVIAEGEPYVGIVYLRPGHILPEFTLQTIRLLLERSIDLPTPFLLVAHRTGDRIKVRIRPRNTDLSPP